MTVLTKQFDLAVCYRIYPRVSGKPVFGFTDKLELVRMNLKTFQAAAGHLRLKIWFLLDNCPPTYAQLIRSQFSSQSIEILDLPGVGNGATFCRQIEILTAQSDAELVYFAEDDYLYLPGALVRGVEFFRSQPAADFLTLYDHADHYRLYLHRLAGDCSTLGNEQWRLVASTCLTFMARQTALQKTANLMRSFARGNSDLGIWLALTKRGVRNPWVFLRCCLSDGKFVGASHLLAWRHGWRQILSGPRFQLFAPKPSLATHMDVNGLAPGVDWGKIRKYSCQVSEL
jgi:hypothetical protein